MQHWCDQTPRAAHLQSEPSRHRPAIATSAGDREDVGAGDDAELRPGEHEGHALLLRQGYGWGLGLGLGLAFGFGLRLGVGVGLGLRLGSGLGLGFGFGFGSGLKEARAAPAAAKSSGCASSMACSRRRSPPGARVRVHAVHTYKVCGPCMPMGIA